MRSLINFYLQQIFILSMNATIFLYYGFRKIRHQLNLTLQEEDEVELITMPVSEGFYCASLKLISYQMKQKSFSITSIFVSWQNIYPYKYIHTYIHTLMTVMYVSSSTYK